MTFERLGAIGLGGYVLLLAAIAMVARHARRDDSTADHFLAGRELGVFVLFLTLYATAYSGNSLLGYPGEAYRRGFSWVMATGFMMSIIVAFHALVPRLRPIAVREAFVTPGDWIRYRFRGERGAAALQLVIALLMAFALSNFLFAQLKAMGEMAEQVTGGIVTYEWGIVVLAAMILLYETVGGMRAVAWTDAGQGILMLIGLATLLGWLVGDAGGLEGMTNQILAIRPGADAIPGVTEQANWMSTIVLLGLASVVYPQAIQRVYAAKSGDTLRRSFAIMTFMPLSTTLVVTWIGFAAIARLEGLGEVEADLVMPLLLREWSASGPWTSAAAVMVFLGALAAIMSTADSVLLSLGSIAADDVTRRPRGAASTAQLGKRIAAGVMIAMAGLAMVAREITLWGLIELKMELLIQCVPAFLLAIHWKRFAAGPAFVGVVIGTLIAISGVVLDAKRIGGVHIGVIGLAVNTAIAWVGSVQRRPGSVTGAS